MAASSAGLRRALEAGVGRLAADRAGDLAGVSLEDSDRLLVHPPLGCLVVVGVKAAGCVPQVAQDVHEVNDDRDIGFAFACLEGPEFRR